MESTTSKRKAEEERAPDAKKIKEQPERLCAGCNQAKKKDEFYKKQWKRGAEEARCKPCMMDKGGVDTEQQGQQQMLCCASCQVNKSIGSFFMKERKRGAEARCNECFDRETKKAQQERQKAHRERQEALRVEREAERLERDRIAALKERALLEANGPQIEMPTFEVPGFGTLWEDEDDYTCPAMVFNQSPATLESLVGSYDLIFYYSYGDGEEYHQNRVTKGSLDFAMDEATGALMGSVAIDKSVKNDIWSHHYDCKITCESGSSHFQVTNMDELENICADEVSGTIERVAKRRAVRYMPEGLDAIDYQREYAQSIQFENETEAQSILDNYACENEPLLWLSNHMQFPEQVSPLVRGFATCKPLPIFFFEEDDLWLKFDWDPSHHGDDFGTTLVARRRR
jgi:hypothetical protein